MMTLVLVQEPNTPDGTWCLFIFDYFAAKWDEVLVEMKSEVFSLRYCCTGTGTGTSTGSWSTLKDTGGQTVLIL